MEEYIVGEYIMDSTKSTTLEQEKIVVAILGLDRLQMERTHIEGMLEDVKNDRIGMEIRLEHAVKELKEVEKQKTKVTIGLEKAKKELEEVVKTKTNVQKELVDMRNRLKEFQIENTNIRRKLDDAQTENDKISQGWNDSIHHASTVIEYYFLEEINKLRKSCDVPPKDIRALYLYDSLVLFDNISDYSFLRA
ncbi:hypothetical protein OROHE_025088 [Orobanche hederae]